MVFIFKPDPEKEKKPFFQRLGITPPKIVSPISEEEQIKPEKEPSLLARGFQAVSKMLAPKPLISPLAKEQPQPFKPTLKLPVAKEPEVVPMKEAKPKLVVPKFKSPFDKEIASAFGNIANQAVWVLVNGENARFNPKAENHNKDGTVDRGLFQINEGTYYWMDSAKYWRKRMDQAGIKSGDEGWEQMFDPGTNAKMAKVVYDFHQMNTGHGWWGWYAAPAELRGLK